MNGILDFQGLSTFHLGIVCSAFADGQSQRTWAQMPPSANGCIHSFVVGRGCHPVSINAGNGFVVCLCCCLQEFSIHLVTHHDHLVNGFQRLCGGLAGEQLQLNVRQPIDVLDETIGCIGQCLCSFTASPILSPEGTTGRALAVATSFFSTLFCIRSMNQGLHVSWHSRSVMAFTE